MSKTYIAVDIGKLGAIAIMHPDRTIETFAMPKIKTELDLPGLMNILIKEAGTDVHISFEKLGVIFGSGKNVAFSMGQQAGVVEALCVCNSIPYTKVNAKDWQKAMLQGVEEITKPSITGKNQVRDTKAMALVAIKRLFPALKLTFGERATKPHDGLIDAILLCEYARRMNF